MYVAICYHLMLYYLNDKNNILLQQTKKEILGYILEYVYTGEVQVPNIRMGSFIDAAKVLRIIGFENVISPMVSFIVENCTF